MEKQKTERDEMEERNILKNKTKEGLSDQNFKVNLILITMYKTSLSKVKRLPLTFLISSTTFTQVSVQRLEWILMLCI